MKQKLTKLRNTIEDCDAVWYTMFGVLVLLSIVTLPFHYVYKKIKS